MSSNPHNNRRVRCLLCADEFTITLNNLSTHIRLKHPERVGQPRRAFFAELDGSPTPLPGRPRSLPAKVDPPAARPELPPLTADDVVTTVVEQLAEPSGVIPVAHLAAILAWHEATASFLRSVTS